MSEYTDHATKHALYFLKGGQPVCAPKAFSSDQRERKGGVRDGPWEWLLVGLVGSMGSRPDQAPGYWLGWLAEGLSF